MFSHGSVVFWIWLFSVVLRVTFLMSQNLKMRSWEFLQNEGVIILNDGQKSQQALFGELLMGLPYHLLLCHSQGITPLGIIQLCLLCWCDIYRRDTCNFDFPVLKDDFMISYQRLTWRLEGDNLFLLKD